MNLFEWGGAGKKVPRKPRLGKRQQEKGESGDTFLATPLARKWELEADSGGGEGGRGIICRCFKEKEGIKRGKTRGTKSFNIWAPTALYCWT